jgi:nitrite reductase/ring-hydroxylating ferredoxin subunit
MGTLQSELAAHTGTSSTQAPAAASFPKYPVSWYYFSELRELNGGPVTREMFGQRLVAFRTASGNVSVIDARCCHLGTDLGKGQVVGEAIQCPYHHWEFGTDGHCTRIPASDAIPAFARQRCYPTAQRHGFLFVFNGHAPRFALPFYDHENPDDILCSRPCEVVLECPWYLIGANAFDLQHYRASHDRELLGEPVINCPTEFSRRAAARFAVSGSSLQDRLTRLIAGGEASLSITDYCGNMMLATASFRRAKSFGLVMTQPLDDNRVLVRLMVMKRRSRNPFLALLYDRLSVNVRLMFFRNFLLADAERLAGVRYHPGRLIPADQFLIEYFQWLAVASHGGKLPVHPMVDEP